MKTQFKLNRLTAAVMVATASLAPVHQSFAGPGFGDGQLQDRSAARIPTYFANSPTGARVTPVPESSVGQNTGAALRKFVDPLPLLGAANSRTLSGDPSAVKYIPVAVAEKWINPQGFTTNDDYYEIAVVEYTEKFHSDLRKATTLRGYVQLATARNQGSAIALTYPDGSPILIAETDLNGKLTGNKVQAKAYDKPHFLGPIINATKDVPTRVKFINLLPTGRAELSPTPDANGKPVVSRRNGDVFLPIDKSILGSGVGPDGITEYTQNRANIHLHGGDTPWISDGTPHQWITPVDEADPANPRSLATLFATDATRDPALLPNFLRGASAANVPDMNDPGPGAVTYYFPNGQTARMMWYHDHTLGQTRINVYAGMASAYLLTDATEQALIADGTLPPASRTIPLVMQERTFVPDDIALQDAKWNTSAWGQPGDSWFPHVYETVQDPAQINNWNAVGRWHYGPWFWPVFPALYPLPSGEYGDATTTPEAWMDTPIVNGVAYPTLDVDPTTYRFRLLNASNDRMMTFNLFRATATPKLADGTVVSSPVGETEVNMVPASAAVAGTACAPGQTRPTPIAPGSAVYCQPDNWPTDSRIGGMPDPAGVGPSIYQIASEGGWLPKVATIDPTPIAYIQDKGRITVLNVDTPALFMGPAERADIVIDFSQYAGQTLIVYNDSGAPVPAGDPRNDYFTGVGDQSASGGAEDTLPGFGPNTRTMMQIKVRPLPSGTTAVPYDPSTLQTKIAAAYVATQERPVVAQPDYAGFDANWAAIPATQSYASIYTGSLKEPTIKFVPGTPSAAFNSIQVLNSGSGYVTAPLVTITPTNGTGSGASAQATMKIDALTVTNPGSGYTAAPLITITALAGGGNGAQAAVYLAPNVVNVTAGGANYTSVPTVTFTAPPLGGTKPVATAVLTGNVVTAVNVITPGTGYTAAPLVGFTGGGGTGAKATSSAKLDKLVLTSPDPTNASVAGGGGYTNLGQLAITFTGGSGTGAAARATGKVFDITLTNNGSGYTTPPTVTLSAPPLGTTATAQVDKFNGGAAQGSILVKTKTIQELFDPTYGRLNATLGVELPFTSAFNQTTIPLGYVDEPTEQFADGETQIWKITHNGVDTHPVHFHLMNVQLINRVGWDGFITPPLPNELGWKETIKLSPLEDSIIAVRAKKPTLPGFGLPLSVRPMDPTQPLGSPFGFTQIDPNSGTPKTVVNDLVTYGWEYVWHCHILGHEENDFMRPVIFNANESVPVAPSLNAPALGAGSINLSWADNSSTEYEFLVQRSDVQADGVTPVAFSTVSTALANSTAFSDVGAAPANGGPNLAYRLVAVGAAGQSVSNVVITPVSAAPPSAPTGLAALVQSGSQVTLTWADTSANETGFVLERSFNGGATWALLSNLAQNAVQFTDTTLTPNTAVSYRVSAVNANGASAYSTTSAITLGAPAMASVNATVNSATQVTLAWTTVAPAVNQAISSYAITRTAGVVSVSFTAAAGATGFVDSTAAENTSYSYSVNTVNNTGITPVSGPVTTSAAVTTPYLAAGTLTTLAATPNAAGTPAAVTLAWAGGTPATSYSIERCLWAAANFNCTAASSVWAAAGTVTAPASGFLDTAVAASSGYSYRVTAHNGPVNMSNTLLASVTTPTSLVVAAPSGLVANVSFTIGRVALTWTDNATNETTFSIERSTDGVNFAQVGTAAPRTGSTGLTRTFNDTAVSIGQSYWYRVVAQNVTGAVVTSSAPSNVVKIDYFLVAPTGLTAALASPTRITLNWVDTTSAEASFAVWRSDNGAAAVQIGTVTRTAAQGTATGGAVTFNDNNSVATPIVLGHSYSYYVTAVNGAVVSPPSNTFSVAFLAPAAPASLAAGVTTTSATRASVALSWPATLGTPAATSYTVQRRAPGALTWTNVITNTAALTVTQTNVLRNATTPYLYQVRANGTAGNSGWTQFSVTVN